MNGTKIPGQCPECAGSGCAACDYKGTRAFTIPTDVPMFTKRCIHCGSENGIRFVLPGDTPPEEGTLGDPPYCVFGCRSPDGMRWRRID